MERLLFEIGTEEIPANFMQGILAQLQELGAKKLQEQRIPFQSVKVYGTPRRVTFIAEGVAETQADSTVEAKGPSVKIAFKDGAPSKAAEGFARGQGVDVKDLEVRGEYVYAVKHLAGQAVVTLLPEVLNGILNGLSFPKNMRWADHDIRFVRPVHWLVALYGNKVVPVEFAGVKSGNKTRGHRFLSSDTLTEVACAGDYEKVMESLFVMVDQDVRKKLIRQQVEQLAVKEGGQAEIKEDLLEEVTYLVEYPTALCGQFETKFLQLPKECIITPMREHQRYFPVLKADGTLLNKFITVRNGGEKFLDVVAHGNERVLRARLSDAEFFFKEDRKLSLEQRLPKLETVSFQEDLGNMRDKSERMDKAETLLNKEINVKVDQKNLERTALLCKADLVAGMVVEFTELQGVMGREYAKLDGEAAEVSTGIFEHYLPRFAGDVLPATDIGRLVGIADKLDNIVATFSRGLAPTGSQDPYALRRQALGIINIIIAANYHFSLNKVLGGIADLLNIPADKKTADLLKQIIDFIKQRLKNMLIEQGIRYDVVDAVLAESKNDDVADLYKRALALNKFVVTETAEELIQAATRVNNLCKKSEGEYAINTDLFQKDAETVLHNQTVALNKEMLPLIVKFDYEAVLAVAVKLVPAINKFFDDVMVMDKDENVKNNRLALLAAVQDITNAVGDLGCIVQQ
ncbi:MAG: glycine--tRNA ligase subunit beta [Phascolarctobacterium sp.]|nr:glycine--tRNA ligase subunit beta [Candidatus Phascolarctobacterium caballi]